MSRTRADRTKDFDKFYDSSKATFESFCANDVSASEFKKYYSFYVCPGSRNGGTDKRIVEVFFGNRAYEIETKGRNWKALTEIGATLSFYRNDTGHLTIFLHPAFSENRMPIETSITLHKWIDPKKLKKSQFVKSLWNDFMAYMECTSLDGTPTLRQKIRISFLRNFKNLVINGKGQPTRIANFSKSVLKFVLTVGLSGFIFFIVSLFSNPKESTINNQLDVVINRLDVISSQFEELSGNNEFIEKTNNQLDTLDLRLKELISISLKDSYLNDLNEINKDLNTITKKIDKIKNTGKKYGETN